MYRAPNYHMYAKVLRKYFRRNWRTWYWIEYDITTVEGLNNLKHTKQYRISHNLPIIVDEVLSSLGKSVHFFTGEEGILTGLELTNEDYYYIYTVDGVTHYMTCCSGFYVRS